MKKQYLITLLAAFLISVIPSCRKGTTYKTLIISNQSDNDQTTSSAIVRQILDETGMFTCTVRTTPAKAEDMSTFSPNFSRYKLVVLDYAGDIWPEKTIAAFKDYLNNGGGVVVCNPKSDPLSGPSDTVTVSKRQDFEIRTVVFDHPVTKGLPVRWLHANDELVHGVKVGGENVQILASANSGASFPGAGRREPVLFAGNYGKGRIFTTLIGTPDGGENAALHCTGFIVTLQRGAEWAASGSVTSEVPFDFPTAAGVVLRTDFREIDLEEAFANIGNYDIPKSTRYFTWLQSQIRKAAGNEETLLMLEKKMDGILTNKEATVEAKKLILRELSWMGTDYSIPVIKSLENMPELRDDMEYALTRLQITDN